MNVDVIHDDNASRSKVDVAAKQQLVHNSTKKDFD